MESRELPYLFLEKLVAVRERDFYSHFALNVVFHSSPALEEPTHPATVLDGAC